MATWGDPGHQVWNSLAILLSLVALYAIARIPVGRFEHGRGTKVGLMVAVLGVGVAIGGYPVPVGLVLWPVVVRRYLRPRRSPRALDTGVYTIPGYGDVTDEGRPRLQADSGVFGDGQS